MALNATIDRAAKSAFSAFRDVQVPVTLMARVEGDYDVEDGTAGSDERGSEVVATTRTPPLQFIDESGTEQPSLLVGIRYTRPSPYVLTVGELYEIAGDVYVPRTVSALVVTFERNLPADLPVGTEIRTVDVNDQFPSSTEYSLNGIVLNNKAAHNFPSETVVLFERREMDKAVAALKAAVRAAWPAADDVQRVMRLELFDRALFTPDSKAGAQTEWTVHGVEYGFGIVKIRFHITGLEGDAGWPQ